MISNISGYSTVANSYFNQTKSTSDVSTASNSQTTAADQKTLDELILSDAVQQLMNALSANATGETKRPQGPPPGGMPPEDLKNELATQVEEKKAAFDAELKAKLEAAGVDTEQDIELGFDESGQIVVTSDVSAEDKAAIESILAEDAELSQSFQELSNLTSQTAEMEERFGQMPPMPPQGMQGQSGFGQNMSSVASVYASHSDMNVTSLLQQLSATLGT